MYASVRVNENEYRVGPMLFYLPFIKHHGFLAVCTRIYYLYQTVASPCHSPRGPLTKQIAYLSVATLVNNSQNTNLFFFIPRLRLASLA
jgi:hypothetical protein